MEPIKSKLIKIGNSRGIRIPKYIVELSSLDEEIELVVDEEAKTLHIRPKKAPREHWDQSFKQMHKNHDDVLLVEDGLDSDIEDDW